MLFRLIPILILLLMVSCSQSKQITADLLTSSMTSVITASLSCQDSTAVQVDVKLQVDKWFEQKQSKSIGSDLCQAAVSALLPALVGSTVPAAWKCTGKAPADLAAKICLLVP